MILNALCELAQAEKLIGDPDYEYKPVSWVVRLMKDGKLVTIEDHRRDLNEGKTGRNGKPVKAKWSGKDEPVPVQPIRTSGDLAFFLVDKAEYALGLDPAGVRSKSKLKERARLFRDLVEACAGETRDSSAHTVLKFLESIADVGSTVKLPKDASPSDLFAFRVGEGEFVHQRQDVRGWWKNRRTPATPAGAPPARFRCLVTGEPIRDVELFPLIKRVPGGTTSGVALVSHNARAFESYGLDGNENAPISREAAQAAATALNRLLDPEPIDGKGRPLKQRHIRLSSDTAVVYWSPEGDPDALDAILGLAKGESAEAVAEAYRSVWHGVAPSIQDPSRFYAMTLTGTQGRVVVRDWFQSSVTEVIKNLAGHFDRLRVVRNTSPARGTEQTPTVPLWMLMDAMTAPGRDAKVPGSLASDFVHAALRGTAYPMSMLQRCVLRERAESTGDEWIDSARRDARAAFIKAVLLRNFSLEVKPDMDPTLDSKGYQLGMLLAALERLQAAALGDVNASLIDRCFGAASATPVAVFPRLLRGARHHARKAQESDDRRERAVAFRCERIVDAIAEQLGVDRRRYPMPPAAFPAHLALAEQGMFVLGYHQMRHWLWMNRQERAEWEQRHPASPRAFQWSKDTEAKEAIAESMN
ncbi:MAG: type I-C CRISPR-associated protein Cas8c/Csd1 [Phycisphaerales bacterium]|nr:type I-C CRISPR-associated protein Cas8c/Csd1 [Phycisphaerales bacterium]MCI0631508.1 type I-C CRISPR-associated protein Cas8c/Csd1 [Phycisphaerales bacterium]MCI0676147.1 type I-C CRISPR-associated protein Cas8c/Csd1 [Phycisphaerales bacterium]